MRGNWTFFTGSRSECVPPSEYWTLLQYRPLMLSCMRRFQKKPPSFTGRIYRQKVHYAYSPVLAHPYSLHALIDYWRRRNQKVCADCEAHWFTWKRLRSWNKFDSSHFFDKTVPAGGRIYYRAWRGIHLDVTWMVLKLYLANYKSIISWDSGLWHAPRNTDESIISLNKLTGVQPVANKLKQEERLLFLNKK